MPRHIQYIEPVMGAPRPRRARRALQQARSASRDVREKIAQLRASFGVDGLSDEEQAILASLESLQDARREDVEDARRALKVARKRRRARLRKAGRALVGIGTYGASEVLRAGSRAARKAARRRRKLMRAGRRALAAEAHEAGEAASVEEQTMQAPVGRLRTIMEAIYTGRVPVSRTVKARYRVVVLGSDDVASKFYFADVGDDSRARVELTRPVAQMLLNLGVPIARRTVSQRAIAAADRADNVMSGMGCNCGMGAAPDAGSCRRERVRHRRRMRAIAEQLVAAHPADRPVLRQSAVEETRIHAARMRALGASILAEYDGDAMNGPVAVHDGFEGMGRPRRRARRAARRARRKARKAARRSGGGSLLSRLGRTGQTIQRVGQTGQQVSGYVEQVGDTLSDVAAEGGSVGGAISAQTYDAAPVEDTGSSSGGVPVVPILLGVGALGAVAWFALKGGA